MLDKSLQMSYAEDERKSMPTNTLQKSKDPKNKKQSQFMKMIEKVYGKDFGLSLDEWIAIHSKKKEFEALVDLLRYD